MTRLLAVVLVSIAALHADPLRCANSVTASGLTAVCLAMPYGSLGKLDSTFATSKQDSIQLWLMPDGLVPDRSVVALRVTVRFSDSSVANDVVNVTVATNPSGIAMIEVPVTDVGRVAITELSVEKLRPDPVITLVTQ